MPVTYEPTLWKNHIVRRSRTYTSVTNADGSRTDTPAPGEVFQQGTRLNEINLNHMERGISDCAEAINQLEKVKISQTTYNATIPTSGWTGSTAPYTLQLTVNGILVTDTPIIDIVQTGTYSTDVQICDSWSAISRIVTRANGLTITADLVPSVAIPIQVRCLRNG